MLISRRFVEFKNKSIEVQIVQVKNIPGHVRFKQIAKYMGANNRNV